MKVIIIDHTRSINPGDTVHVMPAQGGRHQTMASGDHHMTSKYNRSTPRAIDVEFDDYAPSYSAGMENRVKALLGETADDFLTVKLDWLLRALPMLATADPNFRLLDYGCGTAALLRLMARRGLRVSLAGCDISAAMLAEGARAWPQEVAPLPELVVQESACTSFTDGAFDLVVISAVLHHVSVAERPSVYAELHRVLRPGGHVVVFEHNPLNPVTRYVVARTPIDANAILLRAAETEAGLGAAGFAGIATRYIMFAPPRLRLGPGFDAALGWLPLGAQYAVIAQRARLSP